MVSTQNVPPDHVFSWYICFCGTFNFHELLYNAGPEWRHISNEWRLILYRSSDKKSIKFLCSTQISDLLIKYNSFLHFLMMNTCSCIKSYEVKIEDCTVIYLQSIRLLDHVTKIGNVPLHIFISTVILFK